MFDRILVSNLAPPPALTYIMHLEMKLSKRDSHVDNYCFNDLGDEISKMVEREQ